MARLDRVARWIVSDVLRELGVQETPASRQALMPVAYVCAQGAVKALADFAAEMAGELSAATAVIRIPVSAGARMAVEVDLADLAAWECEFSGDDLGPEGGL